MNPFFILAALIPIASALTVNTPTSPVVCQPLQISWSTDGSQPPYYLSLIPAGQPTEKALKQFPPQQGSSFTWTQVTLGVGTSFTVALKDGNGQQVYSAPATVQDGGDSSCVSDKVMEGKEASESSSPTSTNSPSGVAVNHEATSSTASSPLAAAGSTPAPSSAAPPASPKSDAPKASGSSGPSPSHSPSVKANSVVRDISSGAVVGIMVAVGLASILVSLVV